ncbi:hypothetical protein ACLEPN_08135, partial [Myxococcus sp. 1LA]
ASATGRGELGPVQGSVTGSVIAGVGTSVDAKVALEDGKLTIGGKAKGALGVGLGVGTSYTIDFNKLKNTVDNVTGGKLTEGAKEVKDKVKEGTEKVAEGAKDVGENIKDGVSSLFKF